jgi:hypothetical protein
MEVLSTPLKKDALAPHIFAVLLETLKHLNFLMDYFVRLD